MHYSKCRYCGKKGVYKRTSQSLLTSPIKRLLFRYKCKYCKRTMRER